jgi:hypothetical protein
VAKDESGGGKTRQLNSLSPSLSQRLSEDGCGNAKQVIQKKQSERKNSCFIKNPVTFKQRYTLNLRIKRTGYRRQFNFINFTDKML